MVRIDLPQKKTALNDRLDSLERWAIQITEKLNVSLQFMEEEIREIKEEVNKDVE